MSIKINRSFFQLTSCDAATAVTAALGTMEQGAGGIIAVGVDGRPVMQFTTGGMFRGFASSQSTTPTTSIW